MRGYQLIKLTAIAPMNMLQAEIYEWAVTLLGMIGLAGIVMLISSAVKSNVLALIRFIFLGNMCGRQICCSLFLC